MKNAIELIEALRYKLRMFGVPIDGPTNVFCDNEAVCKNTTRPESTLTKKHHSIAYHRCREAVAAGTIRVSKEHTSTNLADLFTKTIHESIGAKPELRHPIEGTELNEQIAGGFRSRNPSMNLDRVRAHAGSQRLYYRAFTRASANEVPMDQ